VIADISKYWISLCIAWDLEMYDAASDTPAGVKDTAIAEVCGHRLVGVRNGRWKRGGLPIVQVGGGQVLF